MTAMACSARTGMRPTRSASSPCSWSRWLPRSGRGASGSRHDPGRIPARRRRAAAQPGRRTLTLVVRNTADRPIRSARTTTSPRPTVRSTSTAAAAHGMRLNIPSGTAVRFEPGQQRTVELVDYAGDRLAHRLPRPGQRRTRSRLIPPQRPPVPACTQREQGHPWQAFPAAPTPTCSAPTVGDRVRLADTDLLIEVERDYTLAAGGGLRDAQGRPLGYGEEVKFGGGKTIRDGMGQSQRSARPRRGRSGDDQCADHRPLGHRQGRHRPERTGASAPSAKPATPISSRA